MLTSTLPAITPALNALALTVSGNETADSFGVSRLTNTQGDGLTRGTHAGAGIWPAATNLNDNGNATTNTTGITDHSSTTTRATTGVAKFGTTAFNVVSGNAAANEGPSQAINGGLASTQYTVSAWVILISGAATVRATLSDSVAGKQGGTAVALNTTTWQRVTVTATTGALGITEASYIETTVQAVGTWRIGGWQVETGNVATPYIQTDGADASRSDAGLSINPTGLLNPTQGWIAYRVRMGWSVASEALPGGNPPFLLQWRTDANNLLQIDYTAASDWWRLNRIGTSTSAQTQTAGLTFATGDVVTIIASWTATTLNISFNGGAFATAAHSAIPVLTTTMYLASWVNTRQVCGEVRWISMGSGLLTDGDAGTIHRVGLSAGVPEMYSLPGIATYVWDGVNAVAQVRA